MGMPSPKNLIMIKIPSKADRSGRVSPDLSLAEA